MLEWVKRKEELELLLTSKVGPLPDHKGPFAKVWT